MNRDHSVVFEIASKYCIPICLQRENVSFDINALSFPSRRGKQQFSNGFLVVNIPPANPRDPRDSGSFSGSVRSPEWEMATHFFPTEPAGKTSGTMGPLQKV